MSTTVAEHYENHLAPIYSWMVGDFETACLPSKQFFETINLAPTASNLAFDLGCGHGLQTLPLTQLGFDVVAIDNSAQLLSELETRADLEHITVVNDDLLNFANHLKESPSAIVCMGDTLTHLSSLAEVEKLIQKAGELLAEQGSLCLSFRDYVSSELSGTERFIPVRADDSRIHTCFLEYQESTVEVHDLVHEKRDDEWKTTVSAYSKLRISPDDVVDYAEAAGLTISNQSIDQGMLYFSFVRNS